MIASLGLDSRVQAFIRDEWGEPAPPAPTSPPTLRAVPSGTPSIVGKMREAVSGGR